MHDEDQRNSAGVDAADGTVGGRLRAAREDAGLSVDQVCATTRIRPRVLHDLEENRLGTAGTAVYTRGHIRAVARAVGTDPAPLVSAFDEQVGASAPALSAPAPAPVPSPRRPSSALSVPLSAPPERASPRWLTASLAVLAVLVVLLFVGSLSDDGSERGDALTVPAAVGTQAPEATAAPSASASASPSASAPRSTGAELVVAASGTSWLSVTNGDTTLFEGTVDEGWDRRFEDAEQLQARIGNAGALAATCGGVPVPGGADGAVLTIACTPEGLQRP